MKSKSIGISGGLKLRGNVNRIIEMVEGGMGDNAIAGHFKDEGVKISPQFVRSIRTEVGVFTQKALSKASTKRAIKAAKYDRNENLEEGILPV